jgi:hypothetical protein
MKKIIITLFCDDIKATSRLEELAQFNQNYAYQIITICDTIENFLSLEDAIYESDILLIEITREKFDIVLFLNRLAQLSNEKVKVHIFGRNIDLVLYNQIMQLGVSSYHVSEINNNIYREIVRNTNSNSNTDSKIVVGFNCQSGVGCSSFMFYLANRVGNDKKNKYKVVFIDFDSFSGISPLFVDRYTDNTPAQFLSGNDIDLNTLVQSGNGKGADNIGIISVNNNPYNYTGNTIDFFANKGVELLNNFDLIFVDGSRYFDLLMDDINEFPIEIIFFTDRSYRGIRNLNFYRKKLTNFTGQARRYHVCVRDSSKTKSGVLSKKELYTVVEKDQIIEISEAKNTVRKAEEIGELYFGNRTFLKSKYFQSVDKLLKKIL